jgi:hypothetical protein
MRYFVGSTRRERARTPPSPAGFASPSNHSNDSLILVIHDLPRMQTSRRDLQAARIEVEAIRSEKTARKRDVLDMDRCCLWMQGALQWRGGLIDELTLHQRSAHGLSKRADVCTLPEIVLPPGSA